MTDKAKTLEGDHGGRRIAGRRAANEKIDHAERREGDRRSGMDRRTTPRHYAD